MTAPELSERKQRLLMALVERHIRDGQPVGSKTLAEGASLQVSSATIRNIMAELEDIGVLASPHTSAGRIPTAVGYRLYVDALLRSAPMLDANARGLKKELEQLIDPDQSPAELVAQASRALAELTRMAGVVVVPRREVTRLRMVEFLPLSGQRVLVILVINRAEVQNRVIHTDREYGESELRQAANYINRTYAGCDLDDICDGLLKTMAADKRQMDLMMQTTMDVAAKALRRTEKESGEQYVVSGEANLLDSARGDDLDKLRDLFEAGDLDKAHDLLAQALAGLDTDLARECLAITPEHVSLSGWSELVEAIALHEGEPITGVTLAIANDADSTFEKGQMHRPYMMLGLYSDEGYAFSAADVPGLIAETRREDGPAWAGHDEDIEVYLDCEGLDLINTRLLFHKQRHFFPDDAPDSAPRR